MPIRWGGANDTETNLSKDSELFWVTCLESWWDCEWTKEEIMSWFKRHLNWMLLIILFIGVMLYAVADMVSWYILLRISGLIVMLVAQIWYLTKKGRSLGWLEVRQ